MKRTAKTVVLIGLLHLSSLVIAQAPSAVVPEVPRYPLGVPEKQIPEWEKLHPACKGVRLADIKPCMQSFVDYGSIVGLVTLVDSREHGVSLDAVGQYKEDSIFQIMSLNKPFTAMLVLKLIEEGKIPSIDSRIRDIRGMEDFPYREVTVRQLLTHTSGMWFRRDPAPGVRMGVAPHLTNRLDKDPGTTARDKTLDFIARHYANPTLYPLEGNAFRYSNIGYVMLGWMVERVSGAPYEQYLRRTILDPLQLKDTFIFPDRASAAQRNRIARLDRRLPDPPDYDHYDELRAGWKYPAPEGGLYSTAQDLQRFMRLMRHRGQIPGAPRILSEKFISFMLTDLVPGVDAGCNGQGRGAGFAVIRNANCAADPDLSAGSISHGGRFLTDLSYDPGKDVIVVFLYQKVSPGDGALIFPERDTFKHLLARTLRR